MSSVGRPFGLFIDPNSGFCEANGIYYSKRESIVLPEATKPLDITNYIFSFNQNPGDRAVINAYSQRTLTYSALRSTATHFEQRLHALGIRKGNVVMVASPASIELFPLLLAILSRGAILTPINPLSTESEIISVAGISRPVLIVTEEPLTAKFHATHIRILTVEELTDLSVETEGVPKVKISQQDVATILYSSGTSGKSKGVALTHRNFIATVALNRARHLSNDRKVCLFCLPLFHVYGFRFMLCSFAVGSTLILLPKFELRAALQSIELHRVTLFPTIPYVLSLMVKSSFSHEYDLSSLKHISLGGAPLGKELIHIFNRKFPCIQIRQAYGLTETTGGVIYTNNDEEAKHEGTVGLLTATLEARIVDPDSHEPLPPNQKGELWLRGPTIMKGYVGDEAATLSTLDCQGWLKTGDVCYINEGGFVFVEDRLKDLIKYKSFQVAPVELEELLLAHPKIIEAAVIPYPDKEVGQLPIAFVVKGTYSSLTESEIISFISERVAPYKKIHKVIFVESIRKTSSGKILRKELIKKLGIQCKL